ncbi:MAG: ATP-dependent DNA ligase [Myxococcales bacterium]
MRLAELAQVSSAVAQASKRSEKVALLATCLRAEPAGDRCLRALYLAGQLPQAKLGVGPAQIFALASAPAESPSLELTEVDQSLTELAAARGPGVGERRTGLLGRLWQAATTDEQRFLRHLLLGELRQGALEALVLEAVARATGVSIDSLRRAHMFSGQLAPVVEAAFDAGETGLARFGLTLFRPVLPMLAEPAEDLGQALAQLGRAVLEFKLDGARIQVHKAEGEVRVYSRSGQDVSAAVPEIGEFMRTLPSRELVLDGEVIALRGDGRPLPFQETMRRFGRKLDVPELRASLPLTPFFFDCLRHDGQTLLDASTLERGDVLVAAVPASARMPRLVTDDLAQAEAFLESALSAGHEGIMAKSTSAPYLAGRRGQSWLKIKSVHTLDLVVLAAEWGSGRRRGFLSNLHLGARDPESGGFVMLGKTFKGLTDVMLESQTRELLARELSRDAYTVYVKPELVVEIAFNDVQTSPQYPGGVALRFARVKRYRPDKIAGDADTIEQVRALHHAARK